MRLRNVRIKNFRSIESQEVDFGTTTVLFGKNDSGKSNVVKALEFAFDRSRQMDISNVHISSTRPEPKETNVIVDVHFSGDMTEDYQWLLAFGENVFDAGNDNELSLSFRTEAAYNPETRTFEKTRYIITDWRDELIDQQRRIPSDLLDSIDFILLDAHRDIAEVVRDRYSRWNQEVRKADISDEVAEEIESGLSELGKSIVKASPFLTAAENDLKGATDHRANKVEIAPVTRSLNELYRSLDVLVTEDTGPSISVALFGAGTRSRAEFMAFKALIDITKKDAESNGLPYYCLAVFEEPEAHIHPQSQQQLLMELEKLGSQRVVTTHSPYLLAKAPMNSLTQVRRENHTTVLTPMNIDLNEEQRRETERYLLRTHGELLFANAVVFAEGETEEQALPIFFERMYGKKLFEHGITLVTCGGNNYEPFIRIANRLSIPWFIFSDAEANVLDAVKKQISNALSIGITDLVDCPQVITCRMNSDYEAELIADGYSQEMLTAIRLYDAKHRDSIQTQRGKKRAMKSFDSWMRRTNGREKSGGVRRDYNGPEGEIRALSDYMDISENKTRYATSIAEEIAGIEDDERCVPSCIRALFTQLDTVLHISEDENDD